MEPTFENVLNFEGAAAQPAAQVRRNAQKNHTDPISSSGSVDGVIERHGVSQLSGEEDEQANNRTRKKVRSVLVKQALRSVPPPAHATEAFRRRRKRGAKRKAASDDDLEEMAHFNYDEQFHDFVEWTEGNVEEYRRALETRNKLLLEWLKSVDLAINRNLQQWDDRSATTQWEWFYLEMDYQEKRDRQWIRMVKKMISALSGFTKLLLMDTPGGVDYINFINRSAVDVVDTDVFQ